MFVVQYLLWFFRKDLWRSFYLFVLLLWLPMFGLGGNAVNWRQEFVVAGLAGMPLFWCIGVLLRATWFAQFYRASGNIETDYRRFSIRK